MSDKNNSVSMGSLSLSFDADCMVNSMDRELLKVAASVLKRYKDRVLLWVEPDGSTENPPLYINEIDLVEEGQDPPRLEIALTLLEPKRPR